MFWFYLFIFYPPTPASFSPSSLKAVRMLPPWSEAEWGDLALFPSPCWLQPSFIFIFFKHVYASNLCTSLCQGTSSALDWCSLAAPCVLALRKKGDDGENRGIWSGEEIIFRFSTQALWSWKAVYIYVRVCFFKSTGKNKREDCGIHCLGAMLSLYF